MEVEFNPNHPANSERDDIISFLTYNDEICFKNQQRWDPDLTTKEKFDIALKVFQGSKLNFLIKFGKYLKKEQLGYFKQFTVAQEPDNEEIDLVLTDLYRKDLNITTVKNRRYEALKQMIDENSYFSEIEMMKRNPLLYEQLVGQYMTVDEVKQRDKYRIDDQVTLVKILMEGIERDNAERYRQKQEQTEDGQMEEDEDQSSDEEYGRCFSPAPSTSRWGEFEEGKMHRPKSKPKTPLISFEERSLLKHEFINTMYQNFLDGNDEDFDYITVDNNPSYDNISEIDKDEEDKYFASEEPAYVPENNAEESSEDELDMYMNALNPHPAVGQLSNKLKKF